jgi:hypothetical protein
MANYTYEELEYLLSKARTEVSVYVGECSKIEEVCKEYDPDVNGWCNSAPIPKAPCKVCFAHFGKGEIYERNKDNV